jgi:hypothetical protein
MAGHTACMGEMRSVQKIFVVKSERMMPLAVHKHRQGNTEMESNPGYLASNPVTVLNQICRKLPSLICPIRKLLSISGKLSKVHTFNFMCVTCIIVWNIHVQKHLLKYHIIY